MHPPVLDDLGLVPAIEAAAHAVPSPRVAITIENRTGYTRAERPPQEVELAAYRIVVEAIANAVRHADARLITVNGEVGKALVRIDVVDDGIGITDERVETALRSGRLGLASMRRRADSIDATFEAAALASGGTRVSVAWTA
jgi:two-component system NarL family sensor kinase